MFLTKMGYKRALWFTLIYNIEIDLNGRLICIQRNRAIIVFLKLFCGFGAAMITTNIY